MTTYGIFFQRGGHNPGDANSCFSNKYMHFDASLYDAICYALDARSKAATPTSRHYAGLSNEDIEESTWYIFDYEKNETLITSEQVFALRCENIK